MFNSGLSVFIKELLLLPSNRHIFCNILSIINFNQLIQVSNIISIYLNAIHQVRVHKSIIDVS